MCFLYVGGKEAQLRTLDNNISPLKHNRRFAMGSAGRQGHTRDSWVLPFSQVPTCDRDGGAVWTDGCGWPIEVSFLFSWSGLSVNPIGVTRWNCRFIIPTHNFLNRVLKNRHLFVTHLVTMPELNCCPVCLLSVVIPFTVAVHSLDAETSMCLAVDHHPRPCGDCYIIWDKCTFLQPEKFRSLENIWPQSFQIKDCGLIINLITASFIYFIFAF